MGIRRVQQASSHDARRIPTNRSLELPRVTVESHPTALSGIRPRFTGAPDLPKNSLMALCRHPWPNTAASGVSAGLTSHTTS